MNGSRLARNLGAAVVAGIAAAASYEHMRGLALAHGQPVGIADVLPLSVDGLMVVASVAMIDDKRAGRRVRPSAWFAFVLGIGASIAANIAAALPDWTSRVISAWPAVALLVTVELLTRKGRPVEDEQAEPDPAVLTGRQVLEQLAADGVRPSRDRLMAGLRERGVSISTGRASALYRSLVPTVPAAQEG